MIAKLRNQNMRQAAPVRPVRARWAATAPEPRPRARSCAGELGPHMANHLEALGNVLQLLAHIFAEVLQCAAAIRAALVLGSMSYRFAREMRGQRLAPGPRRRRNFGANRIGGRFRRCLRGLQLFQFKFKLLQLNDDLLTLPAKDRTPQLLDDQLQMFDLLAARAQFIALFGELLALRGKLGFERGQFFFLPGRSLALLKQLIQKCGAIAG